MTRPFHLIPIIVLSVCLGIGLATVPASAQKASGKAPAAVPRKAVVAVLDLVAVRRFSLAGKSINSQFDAKRKELLKQAASEEKKFHSAREELTRQRSLLSSEAIRSREDQFRQEFSATQRKFQLQKRDLERAIAASEAVLQNGLQEVLKEIVAEKRIDLILRRTQAVYTGPGLDITLETIARLNKRLPKVVVPDPDKK